MIDQIPSLWLQASFFISLACTAGLFLCVACGKRSLASLLGWSALLALAVLLLIAYQTSDHYTGHGFTEGTWYQLRFGLEGVTWGLVAPVAEKIVLTLLGCVALMYLLRKYIPKKDIPIKTMWALLIGALLGPGTWQILLTWVLMALSPGFSKDLEQQLVQPITQAPQRKKSVVYIYAESLEQEWSKAYPELTPQLNELDKESFRLTNLSQAPFTGWTIAGIISSQCGFPALGANEPQKEVGSKGMVCLGDVLAEQGYNLTYLNGADIKFAGKDLFFKEHGFNRVLGKKELLDMLPQNTPVSTWGVYDDDLFAIAKKELALLNKQNKPFVLSMLTVDTHQPFGHLSKSCPKQAPRSDLKIMPSVYCSDMLISAFVRFVRTTYPDVLVVVGSDHFFPSPQMRGKPSKDRRQRWSAWGYKQGELNKQGTLMDVAPTLLHMMGVQNNGMHLGRNLFTQKSLREVYGQSGFDLRMKSVFSRNDQGRFEQTLYSPKLHSKQIPSTNQRASSTSDPTPEQHPVASPSTKPATPLPGAHAVSSPATTPRKAP